MLNTQRAAIDDFLAQRRIAVVGVSHNDKDFSRMLFREFLHRGYDLVPVHPTAERIEDIPVARSVRDIQPAVDGALVLTSAAVSPQIVRDCIDAGVARVWLYKAVTTGALNQEAVELCDRNNVSVVAGECPFMFLSGPISIHGFHRFFRILTGTMPR
jgi:uncharacterized protein